MSLEQVRTDLELKGFRCSPVIEGDPHEMVGILSECRWYMMGRMDVMIFVEELPDKATLTLDRIQQDMQKLPDLVQQHYLGGCPPFGAARARMVLKVYLLASNTTSSGDNENGLEESAIEPAALQRIVAASPPSEWCSVTMLAAQDRNGASYFYETSTPFWGRAFYPELRYWLSLVTGRDVGERPAPSAFLKYVNIFLLLYLPFMFWLNPNGFYVFLLCAALIGLQFAVAAIIQWCRGRGHRHPRGGESAISLLEVQNDREAGTWNQSDKQHMV